MTVERPRVSASRPADPLSDRPEIVEAGTLAGREKRSARRGVSVVIPTLNEAKNLPFVLPHLPSCVTDVVIVDGQSQDDTVSVARRHRPDCQIISQTRTGKGDALLAGIRAAREEIVVTLDADGSADPAEIESFVAALLRGADYAKGSRFVTTGGSADITALRRFGNWCLTRATNGLHRTCYTDLCYGYNAFWKRSVHDLGLDAGGFAIEAQMNIRAAQAGLRVVEIPSFERRRIHGHSNLNTMRDGFRVLRVILREAITRGGDGGGRPAGFDHDSRMVNDMEHARTLVAAVPEVVSSQAPR